MPNKEAVVSEWQQPLTRGEHLCSLRPGGHDWELRSAQMGEFGGVESLSLTLRCRHCGMRDIVDPMKLAYAERARILRGAFGKSDEAAIGLAKALLNTVRSL